MSWFSDVVRSIIVKPDIPTPGLLNFEKVSDRLYRGSQPTPLGWMTLHAMGITHVLKLNKSNEGVDEPPVGIVVGATPLPPSTVTEIVEMPSMDDLHAAIEKIKVWLTSGGQKVYVHCTHGHDRTGLIIACYRVWVEGWPKEKAEKEMIDRGFHPELLGLWTAWQRVK